MNHHKQMTLSIAMASIAIFGLLLALGSAASAQQTVALATAQLDSSDAISDALAYLETQQLPSGGFPGWSGEADEFTTIKVVLALAADRRPVSFLTSVSGTTALDYLETQSYSYTRDVTGTLNPGRIGMLVAAVVAGDEDPYAFGVYPSGHTGITVFYVLFARDRLYRGLLLMCVIGVIAALFLARGHYSIDILSGIFFAYALKAFADRHVARQWLPLTKPA